MSSDRFAGDWLVSEYVYNPDGSFAGIVRQRRSLHPLPEGGLRVTQVCEPGPELVNHPMGEFKGEWVFDLALEGRARRYRGPAVLGTGLQWIEGMMTGRGLWPDFGHNFTSFAALIAPDRQITGGKFFNAGEMIANIVGVGVPEALNDQYPAFSGADWPGETSARWTGSVSGMSVGGKLVRESPLIRTYRQGMEGWEDQRSESERPDEAVILTASRGAHKVSGSLRGMGKQYGPQFEMDLVLGPSVIMETMALLDSATGHLVEIRRRLFDQVLAGVEILRLRPEGTG